MSRDPKIVKIAQKAAAWHNGTTGFANKGRQNIYRCDKQPQRHFILTIDREEGVTPACIPCPSCGAYMASNFYRGTYAVDPTHEWYRPDTFKGLNAQERHHVEMGGLLLRKIGE